MSEGGVRRRAAGMSRFPLLLRKSKFSCLLFERSCFIIRAAFGAVCGGLCLAAEALFMNRITAFFQPNNRLANRQPSGNKRHCVVFGTQAKDRERFREALFETELMIVRWLFSGGGRCVFGSASRYVAGFQTAT